MIIVAVDFDGTLCLGNKSHITLGEPNYSLIKKLQKLKNTLNVYIKIVTARGAKNKLSTQDKIIKYQKLIEQFCFIYKIPYDEISFNKEYADLYIDDMTVDQYADFQPLKSTFTNNNIIFTKQTVIKKSNSALFEKQWYEIAEPYFNVPKVLFYNDETIITEKINKTNNITIDQYISILSNFQTLTIPNFPYESYINNLPNIEYSSTKTLMVIDYISKNHLMPTFFHGDVSGFNFINNNNNIFMIDPNYKYIFGNYITDAGKLYFSLVAYEKNIHEANILVNKFGKDVLYYAVSEGLRVCKYNSNYISIVNNIAELI